MNVELPHNDAAEASILGGVILRNEVLAELADLETDDFYDHKHKVTWEAIRNLAAANKPIDVVTLEGEVGKQGKLDALGGIAFFGELALRVPTPDNVVAYAAEVQLHARNRKLIEKLDETRHRALTWAHDPNEMLEETLGELQRLNDRAARAGGRSPWLCGSELVDVLVERAKDPWVDLKLGDEALCNVRVGGTIVVMGGSGSGKSSLVTQLLAQHARDVGIAIDLSIELPAEEVAARIVGIKCDASWGDALRAAVNEHDMRRVLDLPRLYVLDRRRATLGNLARCVAAARAAHGNMPVLVAIDYAQLLDSEKREERQRVADVFGRIDEAAREHRFVAIALSQMSRVAAKASRKGEAIGAESADLGAESAAIERFATVTLSIGLAVERENGSSGVELSVGKWRMGKGDRVVPMTYEGRTGRWRIDGDPKTAAEVREHRDEEKTAKDRTTAELAILSRAREATAPITRATLIDSISGRKQVRTTAVATLIARGDLVEVNQRQLRSKYWLVWTPEKAAAAGVLTRAQGETEPQK